MRLNYMDKQNIKEEMLNIAYLKTQAQGLVNEMTKLIEVGYCDDGYTLEKIGNIIRFMGDVGVDVSCLKDDIKQAIQGEKEHKARAEWLRGKK